LSGSDGHQGMLMAALGGVNFHRFCLYA